MKRAHVSSSLQEPKAKSKAKAKEDGKTEHPDGS